MGYRLHARIPNTEEFSKDLEIGKQYTGWDGFNERWFGDAYHELSYLPYNLLEDFYEDLVKNNDEILKSKNDDHFIYDLYNLEHLKRMIDYAIEHKLEIIFESY